MGKYSNFGQVSPGPPLFVRTCPVRGGGGGGRPEAVIEIHTSEGGRSALLLLLYVRLRERGCFSVFRCVAASSTRAREGQVNGVWWTCCCCPVRPSVRRSWEREAPHQNVGYAISPFFFPCVCVCAIGKVGSPPHQHHCCSAVDDDEDDDVAVATEPHVCVRYACASVRPKRGAPKVVEEET